MSPALRGGLVGIGVLIAALVIWLIWPQPVFQLDSYDRGHVVPLPTAPRLLAEPADARRQVVFDCERLIILDAGQGQRRAYQSGELVWQLDLELPAAVGDPPGPAGPNPVVATPYGVAVKFWNQDRHQFFTLLYGPSSVRVARPNPELSVGLPRLAAAVTRREPAPMSTAIAEDLAELVREANRAELAELCAELGMSIDEANDRALQAGLNADEAALWAQIECLIWLCDQ